MVRAFAGDSTTTSLALLSVAVRGTALLQLPLGLVDVNRSRCHRLTTSATRYTAAGGRVTDMPGRGCRPRRRRWPARRRAAPPAGPARPARPGGPAPTCR